MNQLSWESDPRRFQITIGSVLRIQGHYEKVTGICFLPRSADSRLTKEKMFLSGEHLIEEHLIEGVGN